MGITQFVREDDVEEVRQQLDAHSGASHPLIPSEVIHPFSPDSRNMDIQNTTNDTTGTPAANTSRKQAQAKDERGSTEEDLGGNEEGTPRGRRPPLRKSNPRHLSSDQTRPLPSTGSLP